MSCTSSGGQPPSSRKLRTRSRASEADARSGGRQKESERRGTPQDDHRRPVPNLARRGTAAATEQPVGSRLVIPAGDERTPDGGGVVPVRPASEQLMTVYAE